MDNLEKKEKHYINELMNICGLIPAILGFFVMLGWIFNISFLTTVYSGKIPMAPSTAVLFILYGVTLYFHFRLPVNRINHKIGFIIFSFGLLISLILLILSLMKIHLDIEHFGIDMDGAVESNSIGHISPVSAAGFIIVSISILLLYYSGKSKIIKTLTFILSLLTVFVFFILTISYLLGSPLFYGWYIIPPAFPTSIAFVFFGISILHSAIFNWNYDRYYDEMNLRSLFKLFLVFVFFSIGFVITGVLYYRHYEKHFTTEIENQLSSITDLKIGEIVQWRKERLGDGNLFYKNKSFRELIKRYFKNQNDVEARKEIDEWFSNVQIGYNYDAVFLLDNQFNKRIAFPELIEKQKEYISPDILDSLKSDKIVFQDFYRDETLQEIFLTVLVPIIDNEIKNPLIGIVELRIDPKNFLYPLISSWPTPSKSSETLIIRREGKEVVFLNELKFHKNSALNLRISIDRKEILAVKAANGEKGNVEGKDYRGADVIGNIQQIPNSPWFIVARMDKAEIFEPLKELQVIMLVLIIAFIFGTVTGIGLIWRQQRVRFYKEKFEVASALKESEKKFRVLFENAILGIYRTTPEGDILDCNPALLKMLGFESFEELSNRNLEVYGFEPGYSRSDFKKRIETEGEIIGLDSVWIKKDGTSIFIRENAKAVKDKKGKFLFYEGTVEDITLRKQAEDALRESERKLREAQRTAQIGNWELDLITNKLTWSDEIFRIFEIDSIKFGATYEAFLNSIHPDDRNMVNEAYTNSLKDKAPYKIEHRLKMSSGKIKYVQEMCETFYDENEKPLRSIGTVQDITLRKIAEEEIRKLNAELEQRVKARTSQLEAANKELEAFSYSVSHDLRAPLRGIDGFSLALYEDYKNNFDDTAKDYIDRIRAGTKKMDGLIDSLLTLSRVSRFELNAGKINLSVIANDISEILRETDEERDVEFIIQKNITAVADAKLMNIVLENLLNNAWKFTSKKSKAVIEFGTLIENSKTIYFIKDNGVGFDMKYSNRIFGAFQRLHTEKEYPGTGVGLTTVQRIIRKHNGDIRVESKLNEGTTFYFTLEVQL